MRADTNYEAILYNYDNNNEFGRVKLAFLKVFVFNGRVSSLTVSIVHHASSIFT